MDKFIKLNSREMGELLFNLFGDRLGQITTEEISRDILFAVLSNDEDFQGILRYQFDKEIDELTPEEREEIANMTLARLKKRPWVYDNYAAVEEAVFSVNPKQSVPSYIEEVVETIRRAANDIGRNKTRKRATIRELKSKIDFSLDIVELKEEKDKLEKDIKESKEKLKKYDEFLKAKEAHEKKVADLSKKYDNTLETDSKKIKIEIDENNKKLADINEMIQNINNYTKNQEAQKEISLKEQVLKASNAKLKKYKKSLDELEKEKKAAEVVYDEKNKELSECKQELAVIKAEITKYENSLLELEGEEECPICHSVVTDEKVLIPLRNAQKIYLKEKSRIEGNLKERKLVFENAKKALEEARKNYSDKEVSYKSEKKSLARIKKELTLKKSTYKEMDKPVGYGEIDIKDIEEARKELSEKNKNLLNLYTKVLENNGIATKLKESKPPLKVVKPNVDEFYIDELEEKLSKVNDNIEKATENEGLSKTIEEIKEEEIRLSTQHKYAKSMIGVAEEVKVNIVSKMLSPTERVANNILNGIVKGRVRISPEFCGLEDDKRRRSINVLSGGEAIVVSVAILSALMLDSNVKEKILLIEGGELDNDNLYRLMDAFEGTEIDNVFIATFPRGDRPIGGNWNVIEL